MSTVTTIAVIGAEIGGQNPTRERFDLTTIGIPELPETRALATLQLNF